MQVAQEAAQETCKNVAPGQGPGRPVKGGAEDARGVRGEGGAGSGVRVLDLCVNLNNSYFLTVHIISGPRTRMNK